MTKYTKKKVALTKNQLNKIKKAIENKVSVSMRIKELNPIDSNIDLYFTDQQIRKLSKGSSNITFSECQIKYMKKDGGILPILPLILAGLGAAGAITGGISTAVNSTKQTNEMKRHNNEVEKKLLTGNASHLGPLAGTFIKKGTGYFLKPYDGKGFYLKPYSGSSLDKNSKNILKKF